MAKTNKANAAGIDAISSVFFKSISDYTKVAFNDDQDGSYIISEFIDYVLLNIERLVSVKDFNSANRLLKQLDEVIKFYRSNLNDEITVSSPSDDIDGQKELDVNKHLLWLVKDLYRDIAQAVQHKFMNNAPAVRELIVFNPLGDEQDNQIIEWNGTPGQFAFIFGELIEKGYIELPQKGESAARRLLQHFSFKNDNPSIHSLGRIMFREVYPTKDKKLIEVFEKLPKRESLNK